VTLFRQLHTHRRKEVLLRPRPMLLLHRRPDKLRVVGQSYVVVDFVDRAADLRGEERFGFAGVRFEALCL
jgi:hypothetical protein